MSAFLLDNVYTTKIQQGFAWTEERSQAAVVLASGGTKQEAADEVGVDRSTIYEWLKYPDFCAEIDRLSLMVGVASRAERLRMAMRVVHSRIIEETGALHSDKDVLDWLKFAQSETDGAKIDLSKLHELLAGENSTSDGVDHQQPQQQLVGPAAIEVEAKAVNADSSNTDHELNPS